MRTAIVLLMFCLTAGRATICAEPPVPAWRGMVLKTTCSEGADLRVLVDELSQSSDMPIHLIYPLGELPEKITIPASKGDTLGDALDALGDAFEGLKVQQTPKGILVAFPLPDEALAPLNRFVRAASFKGNFADFIDEFVLTKSGWNYSGPAFAEKWNVTVSRTDRVQVRDLLIAVAEESDTLLRIGISPKPKRWIIKTLRELTPEALEMPPRTISVGRPSYSMGIALGSFPKPDKK